MTVQQNSHEQSNGTQDAPQMHTKRTTPLLAGAFMSSTLYAMLLCTKEGRRWDREHNWFVVFLGVLLTLAWLALESRDAAKRAYMFFTAAGLPIIARGLLLHSQATDAAMKKAQR